MSFSKSKGILFAVLLATFVSFSMESQGGLPYYPSPSWSPDGTKVAIVVDTTVEVYDATTLDLLFIFADHTAPIPSAVWSPDGSLLATPSYDQTIKVWNIENGTLLHTLTGHNDALTVAIWTPNGQALITSAVESNPSLFRWNTQNWQLSLISEAGSLTGITFDPENTQLALMTPCNLSIRDVNTLDDALSTPHVPWCASEKYELDWSPDGTYLVTGSINGIVEIWDAATLQVVQELHVNQYFSEDPFTISDLSLSWVRDVRFSADSETVLAISGDGTINEWDIATGMLISESNLGETITAAAFSPSNDRIAYTTLEDAIEVVPNPITNLSPTAAAGADQTLTVDAQGNTLVTLDGSASTDPDGTIVSYVWTENGVEIATGATPQVMLGVGTHTITLTVTDDDGASATDEVVVTVEEVTNQPPVAVTLYTLLPTGITPIKWSILYLYFLLASTGKCDVDIVPLRHCANLVSLPQTIL